MKKLIGLFAVMLALSFVGGAIIIALIIFLLLGGIILFFERKGKRIHT